MGNDIATFSRQLLRHDPIAPDFVQVELDRCDRFGGLRVVAPTQRVVRGRPFFAGTTEPIEKSTSVTVA